jgi:plastocyanin
MDMRTKLLIILLFAAAIALIAVGQVQAKTFSVAIQNNAFSPKELTVSAGDSVTWTNNDAMLHDVDIDDLAKSPDMHKGETFTQTFGKAGTYHYDCDIHPFMKGTVIVK